MVTDDNDKKTVSMEEFMIRKLGGESAVISEYFREVADLNKSNGTRKKLGDILAIAKQHNVEMWLLNLTIPEIAGYFFVKPEDDRKKYQRRSQEEITKIREQIVTRLKMASGNKVVADVLAKTLDVDEEELRRKDLDVLAAAGTIQKEGKGSKTLYWITGLHA